MGTFAQPRSGKDPRLLDPLLFGQFFLEQGLARGTGKIRPSAYCNAASGRTKAFYSFKCVKEDSKRNISQVHTLWE